MSDNLPAEISTWIDCAQCGRIEKPTISARSPPAIASPTLAKVCLPCERCKGPAMMYLQRAVTQMPGRSERLVQIQDVPQSIL